MYRTPSEHYARNRGAIADPYMGPVNYSFGYCFGFIVVLRLLNINKLVVLLGEGSCRRYLPKFFEDFETNDLLFSLVKDDCLFPWLRMTTPLLSAVTLLGW